MCEEQAGKDRRIGTVNAWQRGWWMRRSRAPALGARRENTDTIKTDQLDGHDRPGSPSGGVMMAAAIQRDDHERVLRYWRRNAGTDQTDTLRGIR